MVGEEPMNFLCSSSFNFKCIVLVGMFDKAIDFSNLWLQIIKQLVSKVGLLISRAFIVKNSSEVPYNL